MTCIMGYDSICSPSLQNAQRANIQESEMFESVLWVAVKELNLSYYIGETLSLTVYTHYGNLI